jgi:hypothetical protein
MFRPMLCIDTNQGMPFIRAMSSSRIGWLDTGQRGAGNVNSALAVPIGIERHARCHAL